MAHPKIEAGSTKRGSFFLMPINEILPVIPVIAQ
jgi:hypothetical protein